MKSMIDTIQQGWNRFGIIGSQIALMAVLFLYGFSSVSDRFVLAFLGTLLLATAHHQWAQASMHSLIDDATEQGNFKVLARLAWLHQDFVVIASALLMGVLALVLWTLGALEYIGWAAAIVVLAGVNASWKATLRFHATSIVLQASAIRRGILVVGGLVGWFWIDAVWFDIFAFVLVTVALATSALRLLVGHLQRYKEHRYRRSYEDSGVKASYVSLALRYVISYATASPVIILPVVMTLSTALVTRVVTTATMNGPMLVLVFGVLLVANQQVASLRPAHEDWRVAWKAQNLSVLRDRLALMIERMLLRANLMSVMVVTVVIAFGLIQPVWWLAALYGGVVVALMVLQVFLLERHVPFLFHPASAAWTHLFAAVLFLTNTLLLSVYYPGVALLVSLGFVFVWWYVATVIEWTLTTGFEWRIHARQNLKIMTGFVLAMITSGLIFFVIEQVPLGIDPSIQGIVLASLFVMITSVIVYSMNAILGVNTMLRSVRVLMEETKESLLSYEEEVSLW